MTGGTTSHGFGKLTRLSDSSFEISCKAGDFVYRTPARTMALDIETLKDVAYEALAEHCVSAWREEGWI